jgi:hypothetical protein
MSRLAAIPLVGAALTLAAFGIVRGVRPSGPASGTRLVVQISPPVDDASREIAEAVVRDRVQGMAKKIVVAGDQLVVEIGDDELIAEITAILERTASLELHLVEVTNPWLAEHVVTAEADPHARDAGIRVDHGALVADDRETTLAVADADAAGCHGPEQDGHRACLVTGGRALAGYLGAPTVGTQLAFGRTSEHTWQAYALDPEVVLDGHTVVRAEVAAGGVDIDPTGARRLADLGRAHVGAPLAIVLDGKVRIVTVAPPPGERPVLHVATPGATEDAAIGAALDLVAIVDAGAVHALHVVSATAFTRAVGFVPRAWPFLALALASLVGAGWLARRR